MEGIERVGIAVAPKSHAQLLLDWSLRNGVSGGELFMVYIRSKLRSVPTPVGKVPISQISREKLDLYKAGREARTHEFCQDLQRLCEERQVKGTFVLVESDQVGKSIVEQMKKYDLTKFILGASRQGLRLKLGISDYFLRHAPKTCQVQCVSKSAKLLAVRMPTKFSNFSMGSDQALNNICYKPSAPEQVLVDITPELQTLHNIVQNDTGCEVNDEQSETERPSTLAMEMEDPLEEVLSSPSSSPENQADELTMLRRQLQEVILAAEKTKEAARREVARAVDVCEWTVKKAEILRAEEQKKRQAAVMAGEMVKKRLEEESRKHAETVLLAESMKKALDQEIERRKVNEATTSTGMKTTKYREFTMEELQAMTDNFSNDNKLGEGSYYKGTFLHIQVAVKVLKRGLRQGPEEIEALSGLNHPHIALLVGGNSKQGHLVYEYLEYGSLQDHLVNSSPIPHCKRYAIAVQVATAVLFLHQAKPKPVVHGRLKASNIILDKNFNSKISDVTISTMPQSPEEREGGDSSSNINNDPKCDVYAIGIILLQLITAGSPVDIVDRVSYAVDKGCLNEILDCRAGDWPLEAALQLACIGLSCTEHNTENRPELESVVRMLKQMQSTYYETSWNDKVVEEPECSQDNRPPVIFMCPILQEIMRHPVLAADGYTYEHEAIRRWLDKKDTSPMTNLPLEHKTLTANRLVRSAICEWQLNSSGSTAFNVNVSNLSPPP